MAHVTYTCGCRLHTGEVLAPVLCPTHQQSTRSVVGGVVPPAGEDVIPEPTEAQLDAVVRLAGLLARPEPGIGMWHVACQAAWRRVLGR